MGICLRLNDVSAFYSCDYLESISIPNGVNHISDKMFQAWSKLTSIEIPKGVTSIATDAFLSCSSLKTIYFTGTTSEWLAISKSYSWDSGTGAYTVYCTDGTVAKNGTVMPYSQGLAFTSNGDGTCYVSGIGTCSDTDILIPLTSPAGDQVTGIGNAAFKDCNTVRSIKISTRVTSIALSAFENCSSLVSIDIPKSIVKIELYLLKNCSALTTINFTGTTSEWRVMSKARDWNYNTGDYTVYCTDGTVSKSGNVTLK